MTSLTERQRKILCAHANGFTLCEIAVHLSYSYVTIRKDVEKTKKKLGAFNLAQAVVLAVAAGEIVIAQDGNTSPSTALD